MKFRIHNRKYEDSLVVEGDTIEEVRKKAFYEEERRGWKREDCWSEEVKE